MIGMVALVAALAQTPDPAAVAVLDTAIERMGGAAALRGVARVRLEMMTQWLRTSFDGRPYSDFPSYERHSDLRDYGRAAWRNTRSFTLAAAAPRYVTDVVVGDVAIRDFGTGFSPLNVAYVDERRELFALTPDRTVLLFRDAADLHALADTTIDGMAHARVGGTIDRFPAVLHLRRSDGLPAMLRFRAAQANDFGLTQWGEMDVEVWYSNWAAYPGRITIPTQWDVSRVGRPYKRMTVLAATFNPEATPDSFPLTDSLRAAFLATASRPMHDVALDSARAVDPRVVAFNSPLGAPVGAVRLGDAWVLLEVGRTALNADRALEWLRRHEPGARIAAAVVSTPFAGSGGVLAMLRERIPVHVAPLAQPVIDGILRAHGTKAGRGALQRAGAGRWLRVSTDSLWLEAVDLPNARGAMLVYVPSLELLYSNLAIAPLDQKLLVEAADRRGWKVTRVGHARGVFGQRR